MNRIFLLLMLIIPAYAHSTTYYVDSTPATSAATNCTQAQNVNTAHDTISEGLSCLVSGDTLIIKAGSYTASIRSSQLPSGTSWETATTIKGAAGEIVTITPTTTGTDGRIIWLNVARSYIIFDNLILNANDMTDRSIYSDQASHHIRIQNTEIMNATGSCISIDADGSFFIIDNMISHGCGNPADGHGIYIRGPDNIVENSLSYGNNNYGIQLAGSEGNVDRVIVRNNISHSNGSSGIVVGGGSDSQIYNNIIYNNGLVVSTLGGIRVEFGSPTNELIYNNTIYDNAGTCIRNAGTGTIIRNNICYQNSTNTITNSGTATITNNLFTDPDFINAGANNFRLNSGSDAIDTGFDVSSIVTTDFDGVSRPQNGTFDIGAFEFESGGGPPSVVSDNSSYSSGATITLTADNGLDGLQEWVAIYISTDADSALSACSGCWKYLNGQQTPPSSPATYPVDVVFNVSLPAGTYNARYFASNGTSNRLAISSNFVVTSAETTPPTVNITAPTSSAAYSTTTTPITTIAGGATDNVGVTSVTWENSTTTDSGSASGCSGQTSCSWSVASIVLSEGANLINVTASDAASNTAQDTITVTLDTIAPTRINGGPTGSLEPGTTQAILSLTTNETATCKYGTSAGVSYASQPNTFSSTNSTSHSTTVTSLLDGNSYTYYVRCKDALDNANGDDFSISFSVSEDIPVFLAQPQGLSTTTSGTVTQLASPSTLSTTASGPPTVLGSPLLGAPIVNDVIEFVGNPIGISKL